MVLIAARNGSSTSAVFLRNGRRWARRMPAKVADTKWRGGRRRITGEEVQVAQRRMTQPQGVDREPPARFGREKRRDGLGRCRQGGLAMLVTPFGKAGDGGAVSAPRILGAGGAAIIGGGGLGFGKTQCRHRQLDDGLELEPVTDLVRIRPCRQPRRQCLDRTRRQCHRCRYDRAICRSRSLDHVLWRCCTRIITAARARQRICRSLSPPVAFAHCDGTRTADAGIAGSTPFLCTRQPPGLAGCRPPCPPRPARGLHATVF